MSNIPIERRRQFVGSSESAALLGVSRFYTRFELWHRKRGAIEAADLDMIERIQAGRFLEPAIAAWAQAKWDWRLTHVEDYDRHPTIARMGASLDYIDADGCPVEIKNVDGWQFEREWGAAKSADASATEDIITDAPVEYLIQVQHQLACRPRAPHGWLVACVGGNRLLRMKVPRHPEMIARIEREVVAFWQSVDAGDEPKPDFAADADLIATLYAEAAAGKFIDMSGSNHMAALCADYQRGASLEKEGKAIKARAKGEMLTLIKDAAGDIEAGEMEATKAKVKVGEDFSISLGLVGPIEVPAHTKARYVMFRVTKRKEKTK